MAFDKSKDVELWGAVIANDKNILRISVYSYNGGEKKLQIGPRTYTKKNGDDGFGKAGRLTTSEAKALAGMMPAILEVLEG